MAPRTTQRHSHQRLSQRIQLLVDGVPLQLNHVILGQLFRTQRKEAGRDELFAPLSIVCRRKQVARHLFLDEPIVRLVFVE